MKQVIVCIDIGGSSMKTGICDMDGKLDWQEILPVHQQFEDLMGEIGNYIEKGKEKGDVIGIALSAPGAVDTATGIIGGKSAVPCIHGPSWTEELEKRFGLPASIENDANCAAMAEVTFGNGRGCKNPERILLGGGISSRENFAEQVEECLKRIVREVEQTAGTKVIVPDVKVCSYRKDANLAGAAAVFMQKYPELAGR